MVNGELSQIGDNDSGRIFYFYFDEDNPLKMDWLINLIQHFINDEDENLHIKEIEDFNNKEINLDAYLRVDHPPIKVFNEDNVGSYSLAVGDKEFFGAYLLEKISIWTPILFYIGPYMDIVHWQKFDIRAYIPHIVLLVVICLPLIKR